MRFNFCGPSYTSQSPAADAEVCRNLYPESIESQQGGKSAMALYPVPGKSLFLTFPDKPNRGGIEVNGRTFRVSGSTLYEIFANGTKNAIGAVGNDGKQCSFAASKIQVMIASAGNGYCFTLATGALSAAIGTLVGVKQMGYCDGFFLGANTQQVFISGALDGLTWDPTQFIAPSVTAGAIISTIVNQRTVCLLCENQSVCYYDSGNSPVPFDVIPGGFMEQGAAATFGASRLDNSYFWWGQSEQGYGVAWRANGYTPQRVSNHAIEFAVMGYGDISDAVSWPYQDQGHSFWVTRFPSANQGRGATWAYDVATGMWHERDHFINGQSYADLAQDHTLSFGKHLVGDWQSGNLYQMAIPSPAVGGGWNFVTDAGNPIRRVRRAPVLGNEDQRVFFNKLVIDLETGLGPIPALTTDGKVLAADFSNARAPQLMLRWSDDYAKTWSNERTLDCGQAGQYTARVATYQLGFTRKGRIFEVSCTDPIPWRFVDAYYNEPVERLTSKLRAQA